MEPVLFNTSQTKERQMASKHKQKSKEAKKKDVEKKKQKTSMDGVPLSANLKLTFQIPGFPAESSGSVISSGSV